MCLFILVVCLLCACVIVCVFVCFVCFVVCGCVFVCVSVFACVCVCVCWEKMMKNRGKSVTFVQKHRNFLFFTQYFENSKG